MIHSILYVKKFISKICFLIFHNNSYFYTIKVEKNQNFLVKKNHDFLIKKTQSFEKNWKWYHNQFPYLINEKKRWNTFGGKRKLYWFRVWTKKISSQILFSHHYSLTAFLYNFFLHKLKFFIAYSNFIKFLNRSEIL